MVWRCPSILVWRCPSIRPSVNIWLSTRVTTCQINFNFTDIMHLVCRIHDAGNGPYSSLNMRILTQLLIFAFWSFLRPFLPKASFGLRVLSLPASVCLCVRVSVCSFVRVCVCQSRACPHDNSPLIQGRITKFGTKVHKTLVKVPIVFGDDRPWPSRSNITWKSNFASFWACPPLNSSAVQARITKFGPKCILALLRSLLILDLIGFDLHLNFQSWNRFFYQIYLCSFVLYLVRPVDCKY